MACVPVLLYEARYGFSTSFYVVKIMLNTGWYHFWATFKVFRLLEFGRVKDALERAAYKIDELFPEKKVLIVNVKIITWVAIRFAIFTHILVCVWIGVSSDRFDEGEVRQILDIYTPNEILDIALLFYE